MIFYAVEQLLWKLINRASLLVCRCPRTIDRLQDNRWSQGDARDAIDRRARRKYFEINRKLMSRAVSVAIIIISLYYVSGCYWREIGNISEVKMLGGSVLVKFTELPSGLEITGNNYFAIPTLPPFSGTIFVKNTYASFLPPATTFSSFSFALFYPMPVFEKIATCSRRHECGIFRENMVNN